MEQVTFIQYYFHNPILCFLFCYCVLNVIVWIEKKYSWVDYLIGSTLFSAFFIILSFIGMGSAYAENKDSITIHPVNSSISNIVLITTLITLCIYSLVKAYSHYSKKRDESKLSLMLIESLKTDFLTLQNHIYKLETASEPYCNRKILELQFELNDVKAMIDGIEFQKDKQSETKKIKNKMVDLRHKI